MAKRVITFSLGALGMVLLGFGALYALHFFSPEYRQEQAALERIKEIQKQYENDTYGGDTPEETIRLFIDALKKGDIDLAAKYFVIDKQEEQQKYLETIKEKNLIGVFIKDLEDLEKPYTIGSGDNKQFIFEAYNDKKRVVLQVIVIKNPNGKWKIERM